MPRTLGHLLAVAALLLAAGAQAMPADYRCSPGNGVVCASNSPPGGLTTAQTPQFVVVTHDDAITVTTDRALRGALSDLDNPNGCNVPVTFFVSGGAGTNCTIANRMLEANCEIATHTMAHAQLVPGTINITDQIASQRAWLNQTCGIALEKMVGFRAPYLLHNPETRQALQDLGFKYDSSIIESWPSSTSPSSASRIWPYSMSAGIPQTCQWMAPSTCNSAERYADLWEMPMLQFESSSGVLLSSMDPTADTADALLAQLMDQFSFSYNGNKAPIGLYLHTPWFSAKPFHSSTLNTFIQTVLKQHNDVWFVTMQTLKAWMESPVPASQMASWLQCNAVDLAAEERAPCTTYTVKAGDSIFSICNDQEVLLDELMTVNPTLQSNSAIYVGQRLRLPPWTDDCPDSLAGLPPCRNHTVVAGDSLYDIAQTYQLTVDDIVSVNTGLTPTSTLSIGQLLHLPPYPIECVYGNFSVPAPAPAPAASSTDTMPGTSSTATDACGSETLELDLGLTGLDSEDFGALLPQFLAGMSALVRVPASCISILRAANVITTASGQRRLMAARSLLSDAQMMAVVQIHTTNATQVAKYLEGAKQLGSLSAMMNLLGSQLDSMSYTALSATGAPIAAPTPAPAVSEAPAPAPAQQPVPLQAATTEAAAVVPSGKKSSKLGAILGGAIGGGVGALILIAVAVYFVRRRQQASAAGGSAFGGLRSSYATTNPTYNSAGASASITTAATTKDDRFQLEEVVEATGTPRSARRRVKTAFNGGDEIAAN